ncbi:hypothetical protein IGX29_28145 [Streptomyces sp. H28]|uniref:hypothetical protein n=1 Tax=Streptomyces sp. H28 TaxID=2775865 RepID=UPI00177F95C5|nr:hypothetical protein [Streptomyces sp. H28]MBD9735605.1 hypothetical protein [Streptomyces sp. H28]
MSAHAAVVRDLAVVAVVCLAVVLTVGAVRDWAVAGWLMAGLPALVAGRIAFHRRGRQGDRRP